MPSRGDASPPAAPLQVPAVSQVDGPRKWTVDGEEVVVELDGSQVWAADEAERRPAVVVRMSADFARHLAAVLDDWTTIGRLLESSRGAEQHDLAGALHTAARVADGLALPARDAGPG
jgi:hypothetical protein